MFSESNVAHIPLTPKAIIAIDKPKAPSTNRLSCMPTRSRLRHSSIVQMKQTYPASNMAPRELSKIGNTALIIRMAISHGTKGRCFGKSISMNNKPTLSYAWKLLLVQSISSVVTSPSRMTNQMTILKKLEKVRVQTQLARMASRSLGQSKFQQRTNKKEIVRYVENVLS